MSLNLFHGNLYILDDNSVCMYLCDTNLKKLICVVPVDFDDGLSLTISIPGLNKVIFPDKAKEIERSRIKKQLYIKKTKVAVDYNSYLKISEIVLNKLLRKTNTTYQDLSHSRFQNMHDENYILTEDYYKYLTWFDYKTKLQFQTKVSVNPALVKHSVVWVELGRTIGSELEKLRPAILFRKVFSKKYPNDSSAIIIPLTSKKSAAKYKTNYPIQINGKTSYAKINDIQRVSVKRIKAPFLDSAGQSVIIQNEDITKIKETIKKYYIDESL